MLEGKKILIGISGSIAAYKTAVLTRLFVKAGAEVKIILTPAAEAFVTPLTLSTLSKHPVYSEFVKNRSGEWTNHVALGLWADVMLIAPLTANTLAKMAHGICDNLLLATYLSARCPVMVAPAMDLDMLQHPVTQNNLKIIASFGNAIIPSGTGELASGLNGEGRMAEPEEIFERTNQHFANLKSLAGKQVLITAGPTYEHIDPVRFIGNHSSGKMGYALAEAFASRGASVVLISGPTTLQPLSPAIKRVQVTTAAEMFEATIKHFSRSHIAVLSAAVSDYAPEQKQSNKIKKQGETLELKLKKTRDILKELGSRKKPKQILVGFALETENEEANARKKMKEKNLDLIVLNSLNNAGAGFGFDTNQVSIIYRNGKLNRYELKPKTEVAHDIAEQVISLL